MRKYAVLLAMLLACMTAFSGCSDLAGEESKSKAVVSSEESEKSKSDEESNSSEIEETENDVEALLQAEQEKKKIEEQLDKLEDEQAALEAELEQKEEQEYQEELENLAEITDIEEIGEELFDKACQTQWEYLIDCPYELDYEDTYEYAVRVIGADSLSDVLMDYNKVFTGDRPELKEKYISTQYALYCYDGGRGANIYYQDTDLELVSCENNTAVFDAVSHYADPETFEPMEDEVHTFVIVRVDDDWRVSEFMLPY